MKFNFTKTDLRNIKIKFYQWFISKLPYEFLYYCIMDAWAKATTREYTNMSPDEVTWSMVCVFLSKGKK